MERPSNFLKNNLTTTKNFTSVRRITIEKYQNKSNGSNIEERLYSFLTKRH